VGFKPDLDDKLVFCTSQLIGWEYRLQSDPMLQGVEREFKPTTTNFLFLVLTLRLPFNPFPPLLSWLPHPFAFTKQFPYRML